MGNKSTYKIRYNIFIIISLLLVASDHLYYQFLSDYVGVWLLIVFEVLGIALFMFIARKHLINYHRGFITTIKGYSDSDFMRELSSSLSSDIFPTEIMNKFIIHQNKHEKNDQELLKKLRNSNILLERNSKITDSIMQITSKILSSGDIDEILQSILDKAIEIIPNAEKGSILIYNGSVLEFRASHGYDSEVLKGMNFNLEEIFQYNSKDFYEPCIVNNPENFNKEHLESGKFDTLRKGRGFELKSILSCAIQVDNEFYGIINLDSAVDKHAFSNEDMPLIKHLATQLGIALKNARLIEKILLISRHDGLTGIYNRCYFEELLMRTFQQYESSGSIFSLTALDINELKAVNDTYGHEAGDLLLKRFVHGVKENLTKDDIFARYGGDEFAIIFLDKTKTQAELIMKNTKSLFSEVPFTYCGKKITYITFGFGVTEFPADTGKFEELINLADVRMYKNKKKIKKPIR